MKGDGIHSELGDAAVNELTRRSIKFGDFEIAVTGEERLPRRIRPKLDILVNHSLTQVYLPFVKADIAPAIDFEYMVFSAIFVLSDSVGIFPVTAGIHLSRTLHPERFMGPDMVVLVPPASELNLSVVNIGNDLMIQQFIFHRAVEPLDLSLSLRMLDTAWRGRISKSMSQRSNCV